MKNKLLLFIALFIVSPLMSMHQDRKMHLKFLTGYRESLNAHPQLPIKFCSAENTVMEPYRGCDFLNLFHDPALIVALNSAYYNNQEERGIYNIGYRGECFVTIKPLVSSNSNKKKLFIKIDAKNKE